MTDIEKEVQVFLKNLSDADELINDLYGTSLACFLVHQGEIHMIGTKQKEILSLVEKCIAVFGFCDHLRRDPSFVVEVNKILNIQNIHEHTHMGGLFIYVKEDNDEEGRDNIPNN